METERLTLPGLLLAFTEVVSMAVDNDINLSRYSDGQIKPPLDGVSKIMWRVLVGDVMLIANLILFCMLELSTVPITLGMVSDNYSRCV